ncbi:MAG: energy coupling factor transporter S component ThiW [Lachnospiraceae bacterium]|nr:energy coupling factor transporter S component ThiW [Lachnospiraceae bacterium]
MKHNQTVYKLSLAGLLTALAVVGSFISIPIGGSKCAPVQHMVNIFGAVLLGPFWNVGIAFTASLLRNLLGLGSLMAFPGSMFGALLCGIAYWKSRNLVLTLLAEVFGTAILGGFCAYLVAILLMGADARSLAFYAYVIPFLISTAGGDFLSAILVTALKKTGALNQFRSGSEAQYYSEKTITAHEKVQ